MTDADGMIWVTVDHNRCVLVIDPGSWQIVRTIFLEVPAEPFHALPLKDGTHILVALANGDIARIDMKKAALVEGGFPAGGTMPEALLHLPG